MSSRSLTLAAGVAVLAVVSYAAYFDYKRRNDVEFRKKLRKEKKRVDKTVASQSAEDLTSQSVTPAELRAALKTLQDEPGPSTPDEREQYFMSQVSMGEQLCTQGPLYNLPAALCFYRALRVYPSPVELITIYQKTVPEPVFKLIMELTNLDVSDTPSTVEEVSPEAEEMSPVRGGPPSEASSQEEWDKTNDRVEGYYENYPPKSMNAKVELREAADGKGGMARRNVLVASKDFAPGDVIYKENAVATVLDLDLQGKGTHCSHCLREVPTGTEPVRPSVDERVESTYCSKECCDQSSRLFNNLLFTTVPPLPAGMAPPVSSDVVDDRKSAQEAFVAHVLGTSRIITPFLVAKFVSRQVSVETGKLIPSADSNLKKDEAELPQASAGEYSLYDHVQRLRFLEVTPEEKEVGLLRDVLEAALPGLHEFVREERHTTLSGKMAYNAFGVYFGKGREDKLESTLRPETIEKTRVPVGTDRQVGSAFYLVSSYLPHSCEAAARPEFTAGTAQLHLVANRAIKAGEELSVSYVDVAQHDEESVDACRRRRRMELARGWRFACVCERCVKEGSSAADGTDSDVQKQQGSKVEASVERLEKEGEEEGQEEEKKEQAVENEEEQVEEEEKNEQVAEKEDEKEQEEEVILL